MRSDWKEFTVNELIKDGIIEKPLDGNHGGIHPKSGDFTEKGVPFIMASDLINRRVDYSNCKFISQLQAETLRKGFAKPGDVLLTHKATIGRTAIIQETEYETTILTPQVTYYRVKDGDRLDNHYLFYYFNSRGFQGILDQWSGGGSTRKYLGITGQLKLPIIIPPLPEQKAIAHILGTLDDKIELNRQMNETLEEMAQALFKSWFVDFDPVIDKALAAGHDIPEPLQQKAEKRKSVPDDQKLIQTNPQFGDSHEPVEWPDNFTFTEELGWIPEGWEVKSLLDKVDIIGGGTPKTSIEDYWNGDVKWFSVVDAPVESDVFVINTEKTITELGVSNSSTKLLPVGTTIISARGTVGKLAMVDFPIAMNQSCYGVKAKKEFSDFINYYVLKTNISDLQQRSHGSVFSTITRDTFKSINIPTTPDKNVIEYFDQFIEGYFLKIKNNLYISDTLKNLRDTLLPKLISGELRVPQAEQIIADHV
ncbi:restriction endonuclease subunit S [Fulvivirga ligni]|uniref:restriction endonuclease subunit S n=1 Tax=Fulvivirga ligni TaxID=2904246 RepID=UPI001F299211|nr:restriction endonuclease subunit S [Fulvivirga ligni]UII19397.1 restriction endonuclease subunit S [Fulvivirga ligni]